MAFERKGSPFTFQYGYSKTISLISTLSFIESFTFQYGYSKTKQISEQRVKYIHLHSSMVIVKLGVIIYEEFKFVIYIPVWL